MENQKKEDEARKKSIPELEEEERRFRVTEEREEIIQRGDGPAIVMRSRNTQITTGEGGMKSILYFIFLYNLFLITEVK